eukprot:TRINITY_DN13057_c0_g2_i1.p1 TRINITY_DN13057_c0_g2~~TRINITY_DN13057_c0_g2_i1.p1  ORF type:complete len:261 (+),score=65.75 TRINITY_DN13057_c0_g2_i1:243-1025(+)
MPAQGTDLFSILACSFCVRKAGPSAAAERPSRRHARFEDESAEEAEERASDRRAASMLPIVEETAGNNFLARLAGASAAQEPTPEQKQRDRQKAQEAAEAKSLDEFQDMARQIACMCQKFPKHGQGLFNKAQDRYFAVVPAAAGGDAGAGFGSQSLKQLLKCWRHGRLAYWDDEKAYKSGTPEKGSVELRKIAKVYWNKDDRAGLSVCVKHQLDRKFCELVLKFSSKREAEQWNFVFWEFLVKIRGSVNTSGGQPTEKGR